MSVPMNGVGCFGEWCDFGGKVIVKVFKVQQLKISAVLLNLTCTNSGQNLSNKALLQ
tara:strand:+ start:34 stop:204 length:171 start_codon:yes stop_codon:yes gene_type:complete